MSNFEVSIEQPFYNFSHVGRIGNVTAHLIAPLAHSNQNEVWREETLLQNSNF